VDTGLDKNEAELAILVLAVALEVLADGDGLDIVLAHVSPNFSFQDNAKQFLHTFLMSMKRSSGRVGARP